MIRFIGIGLVVLVILAVVVGHGMAQYGFCPNSDFWLQPSPYGTYPGQTVFCDQLSLHYWLIWAGLISEGYPCGGGLEYDNPLLNLNPTSLDIVPPSSFPFPSGYAKVSWYIFGETALGNPADTFITMRLRSYTAGGSLLQSVDISTDNYSATQINLTSGGQLHVWTINDVLIFASQGGYFTLQIIEPVDGLNLAKTYTASWTIVDSNNLSPALCPLQQGNTPTPTLTPTPNLTGTGTPYQTPTGTVTGSAQPMPTDTPTPTPTGSGGGTPTEPSPSDTPCPVCATHTPTLWPTSAGGTPSPQPSGTLPPLNTIVAEYTPSPWPVYHIATLIFPTFPASSSATPPTAIAFLATSAVDMGNMAGTLIAINVYSETLTTTTGIAAPTAIAGFMMTNLGQPISYAKSVGVYMPTLWPFLASLLLMAAWIVLMIIIKYGMAMVSFLYKLLLSLVELVGPIIKAVLAIFGL